ncbi:MAG: 3-oxoacyl-[acyl-carrier-protein] reductase [Candidatus Omnitrophica bacterium]|nr:3-oxoacyl-[acyl-carrier-protein] reductase [Candidatus Omnitrophota bacterium]
MRFKDKVVVVTGAGQGIGKEIAIQFAKEGASVAIFDMNQATLTETVGELNQYSKSEGFAVNVTDLSDVEKNINKIIDNFGRVDILINNAGITKDNLILRLSENDWDSVLSVNLKGSFNCIKALVKPMVKQRSGKIINISSVIGIMGNPGQTNYAASKAGLIGVTKSLAKELGARNITVNAVAPGYIKTAMTDKLDAKVTENMLSRIPLGKLGTPGDVAKAVMFLASSDADYISGQVLVVDGGLV